MPETGEEIYSSFCGVPIQRLGEQLGVLVVQSKASRDYSSDEVYALEVVAMVLAEMTELGAFVGEGAALSPLHQRPVMITGGTAQEGAAEGQVWLHEPRVVVTNPIADFKNVFPSIWSKENEPSSVFINSALARSCLILSSSRFNLSSDELESGIKQ